MTTERDGVESTATDAGQADGDENGFAGRAVRSEALEEAATNATDDAALEATAEPGLDGLTDAAESAPLLAETAGEPAASTVPAVEPAAGSDAESEPEPAADAARAAVDAATEPERVTEPETEAPTEFQPATAPDAAPAEARESFAESAPAASVEPGEPASAPATPVPAPARTVGRYVADALRTVGVRYAFTVPGESFLGLLEGLDSAGIRVIATRHEGAAAFMAEAHGQLTGRPAACVATRAVGASNLAIGIHTARQDSTPMFALVGQVETGFIGREAFQEADQAATFGGLATHAAEPRTAAEVPAAVGGAIRAALVGRPGPVLLSLPEDLLDEVLPEGTELDTMRPAPPRPEPDDVRAVLQFVASARRPVILAGAGVLRARTSTDLLKLAELLDVPVIASWRRGDVISNDHPLYLGMTGYGSPSVVRRRLEEADALLVVGSRLSEITSYGYALPGAGQRWAQVDIEPAAQRGGVTPPALSVRADARAFLRAAVARLEVAVLDAASVDARRAANAEDRAAWEAATSLDEPPTWDGPGVHPANAITTLRRLLPDDAIVATDAGNFGLWLARYFRFRRPGTFLGPTSGAMGYALPAAIAAALVHRDRAVVAVAGDGGFAMTMAELETAVREKAKVIAVVFDNERYGTIRMHQERRTGEGQGATVATDLGPIDFTAIARAVGARGARVETDAQLEPALRQALAADRPTVLQLVLDRRWVSPDQTPS
jgi:acetolactate synthase I/II/III large subunit